MDIYIVIPAYEPDEGLIGFIDELKEKSDHSLIVVNDGSAEDKRSIFERVKTKALLLEHEVNRGKGAALKTAFSYLKENVQGDFGVITADADGQHKPADIKRIAEALKAYPDKLILGCRRFSGDIPFRSIIGNRVTKAVFRFATGVGVSDTQTGLRGFSAGMLGFMLSISGERYEYEMNMLLEAAREGICFEEVPIETVYINENKSSHFKPVRDSFMIYRDIIKFSCSSLLSFCVDYLLYSLIFTLCGNPGTANIVARVFSSCFNFTLNKRVVFKNRDSIAFTALKYFTLAGLILIINTLLLNFIIKYLIANEYVAKVVVEMLLFIFSWIMQRSFVFKKKGRSLNEQK